MLPLIGHIFLLLKVVILDIVMLDIMSYSLFGAGFCHSPFKIVRLVLQADKLLMDYRYLSRLVLKFFLGVGWSVLVWLIL